MILDIVLDSVIDSVKLLPFLFITYLIMEYLEHETGDRMQNIIQKSGKGGPIFGSILGVFPQCGFSAAAANLYAGRIITLGTLIAIFLSTSDEMLPIMISEKVGIGMIFKILGIKIVVGIIAGFVIDFVFRKKEELQIEHLCEQHNCHCERGIFKSAVHHTVEIFIYILAFSFLLNLVIGLLGEEVLANVVLNRPIIGQLIASLVGLIPNCAASVVVTQLYLNGMLSAGALIAGLLTGSGVGLLVLFRVNDHIKDNMRIIALLYGIGVIGGLLTEVLHITF